MMNLEQEANVLKRPGGIDNLTTGIVPPRPGQTGHYVCGNCGKRFTHTIPFLFNLGVKCPHCGSFKVSEDKAVVH